MTPAASTMHGAAAKPQDEKHMQRLSELEERMLPPSVDPPRAPVRPGSTAAEAQLRSSGSMQGPGGMPPGSAAAAAAALHASQVHAARQAAAAGDRSAYDATRTAYLEHLNRAAYLEQERAAAYAHYNGGYNPGHYPGAYEASLYAAAAAEAQGLPRHHAAFDQHHAAASLAAMAAGGLPPWMMAGMGQEAHLQHDPLQASGSSKGK
ncbi:unnamed protein product, partial [Polarella glacialis]